VRYKPARDTLHLAGYRIDLSTGPLVPPVGRRKHVGLAAVYEQTAQGLRPIDHGIEGIYGRTREEALARMTEAIGAWIEARESEKKRNR
jgi:hypothetical protein